jgi:hypothetical protein
MRKNTLAQAFLKTDEQITDLRARMHNASVTRFRWMMTRVTAASVRELHIAGVAPELLVPAHV